MALMSQVITFSKCSIDRHRGCSHDYHSFEHSTMCLYTVALILHSTDTPTYTLHTSVTHRHTDTRWHDITHENTLHWTVLRVHSVKIIYNICSWEVLLYIPCAHEKKCLPLAMGRAFSLSPGRVSTCVKRKMCELKWE